MATHQHFKTRVHHEPAYKAAFVAMALPGAQQSHVKWGVPVSVLLAQSALETRWGTKVVDNAYFGIKGHSPEGASTQFATHEVKNGKVVAEKDSFRAYSGFADAADDYGRFFNTDPKFKGALIFRNNPERFIDAQVRAHYATDPKYKKKLMDVIRDNHLDQYDK